MILKFGKYRGEDVRDVPDEYLEWLVDSSKQTIEMAEKELERRALAFEADMSWCARIVQAGYRELARKHHPDVGGNTQEMQEINAAVEMLKEMVK